MTSYYETYIKNPLIKDNTYLTMKAEENNIPEFCEVKGVLPQPFWDNHDSVISCYWKAWELAFKNLRRPTCKNGFVANYINMDFNKCIFMWDSAFMQMFALYGRRAFDFQRTLDNFYAKQHPDGFICREISEDDGCDKFSRFDPTSTGPNMMPWAEWEYYCSTRDLDRLKRVFPVLLAYYRWFKMYRTWPDGSYWSSGWASGTDNMPRLEGSIPPDFYHGHQVWVDTCIQQIFAARLLIKMSDVVGRRVEVGDIEEEASRLTLYVNNRLWDEKTGFYYDMRPEGALSDVKNIGAYWALLAGIVPCERLNGFVKHLENPGEFNRPHRIPSLSAEQAMYKKGGEYWCGGVWAPTNYMALRGLSQNGYENLAFEIAQNHVESVTEIFNRTGTLWEFYAPDFIAPGSSEEFAQWSARPDFVGWSGIPPITVFFEYILGIMPDVQNNKLKWRINLLEEHGVTNYPYGGSGVMSLKCNRRTSLKERPVVQVVSSIPVEIIITWEGGKDVIHAGGGERT